MTPERADLILRGVLASLRNFEEEAEAIDAVRPGSAAHLVAALKQARLSLGQIMGRDEGRE